VSCTHPRALAGDEETPLQGVDCAVPLHDACGEQEGEQQLVALKQGATHVGVDEVPACAWGGERMTAQRHGLGQGGQIWEGSSRHSNVPQNSRSHVKVVEHSSSTSSRGAQTHDSREVRVQDLDALLNYLGRRAVADAVHELTTLEHAAEEE
jgi:hypothetical protein